MALATFIPGSKHSIHFWEVRVLQDKVPVLCRRVWALYGNVFVLCGRVQELYEKVTVLRENVLIPF